MSTASTPVFDTLDGTQNGYGTAGYWYPTTTPTYTALPAGITSITGPPSDGFTIAVSAPKAMALPTSVGGVATAAWTCYVSTPFTITAGSATTYTISIRLQNSTSGRTALVAVYQSDGTTLITSATSPDTYLGVWARITATGPIVIKISGTYPRYQGALFDVPIVASPGRLLCLQRGKSGNLG